MSIPSQIVEQHGNPAQHSLFFQSLVLLACRRERYVAPDKTLENARAFLLGAIQESSKLSQSDLAQFVLAFTHVWHG